ncbi:MAG: zinc ribbon domain-containing protein, partial [Alphaproteobacteria bacterium]|nr:zinc ribbon domain-containing protein [Alphaproteobacteria bacterium]
MTAGPEQTYFDNLAAGRLRLQRCNDCEAWVFYPRSLCPHCQSESLAWHEPSGRGTVYSTSVVRRKPDQGGDHN